MTNLADAVLAGADAFDAADAFDPAERAKYLNASEAMSCIRKQWYQKNTPEDTDGPEDWGYARRGSHGEIYVMSRLRWANLAPVYALKEQVSIKDEERRISATPDGFIWDEDQEGWIIMDAKTFDPRTNLHNLPKDGHVRQIQIGSELANQFRDQLPLLGDHPIVGRKLLYMNASNFNDLHEFNVPAKPGILDQVKGRANRLMKCKDPARLPREGQLTPRKQECKTMCMFNTVCGIAGAGTSTGQGKKDAGRLTAQRTKYISAKMDIIEAKDRQDQAAEQIKAILKKEGVSSMQVDEGEVSLTSRRGSVSYAKVVKENLPDIDLEPYRGSPSETLTVK